MQSVKSVWCKGFIDVGVPGPEHFEIKETELSLDDVPENGVIVQASCFSVDPYLRMRLKSYGQAKEKGVMVMSGFVSGKILKSNSPNWVVGDLFGGSLNFSTVQAVDAATTAQLWKLTDVLEEKNISWGIGVLGMPGSTAYGGVSGVLRPNEGDTIFVSAASGAVGSLVGQIAKNVYHCKTIGSAGGKEKGELIKKDFCYDESIDYRAINSDNGREELTKLLKEKAPDGIDMYFDNVGSYHLEASFDSLRAGGRIAICGAIAGYNTENNPKTQIDTWKMIYLNQRIEGFVCQRFLTGKEGNFLKDMAQWIKEGKISSIQETFYEGIDQWPVAFKSLFQGSEKNKGKVVVRL